MTPLAMSTWGDPAAPKRILLIHGLTSASQIWYRIAQDFASKGYFVIAPDLLGHGNARRSSVYSVSAFADELHPLFAAGIDHPYHAVVGHSLGGVVAAALLPLLKSTRSIPVVLLDPPLELTTQQTSHYLPFFIENVRKVRTPEDYLTDYPSWTKEDAIFRSLSLQLCDVAIVQAVFDHNVPWSFTHLLSDAPDNAKVTVLAADPSKLPCIRVEDLKDYPHVIDSSLALFGVRLTGFRLIPPSPSSRLLLKEWSRIVIELFPLLWVFYIGMYGSRERS